MALLEKLQRMSWSNASFIGYEIGNQIGCFRCRNEISGEGFATHISVCEIHGNSRLKKA